MSAPTRALAALWWRDGLRAWRMLLVRALVPIVLLVVVGAATLTRGEDRSRDRETFTVAVAGDAALVRDALDPLVAERLRFTETDDPSFATAFGADVGLAVPDGAADDLAGGRPITVEVHTQLTEPGSRAASSLLGTALADLGLRTVRRSLPGAPAGTTTFDVIDVQRTREGAQSLYAQVAAALLALHASMLVGTAGSRLAGRRHAPQTVGIMLLPLSRAALARASAAAETGLGLLSSVPIVVPTALGAVAFALLEEGPSALLPTLVAVVAATVVLCAAMVAVGTAIGLRVASGEQVSLLSSIAIVAMAVLAGVVALGETPPPAAIAVVPVAGVIDALRGALADPGLASLAWLAVAWTSTAVATVAVLAVASRGEAVERMGTRAS